MVGPFTSSIRFLFMALEGDEGGKDKGNADKERGLSGTIKDLFAGRLMNYIEVS